MTENEISKHILDAAFKVHTQLGPGLLESVYEVAMAHELRLAGLKVERQAPITISYDGVIFDEGFRADLLVQDSVIVELKSVESLKPVFAKQLLSYLRLADKKLGLLINFNEESLKNGIKRIANGMVKIEKKEVLNPNFN